MIIGKIHPGSGLGDQLFSYITTRTIALDKGYDFGFVGKEFFKGKDFMHLDWGKETNEVYWVQQPQGETIVEDATKKLWKATTPYYDPEVNFIEDGTIIDGCSAQDERYWGHRLEEIREWLKVEPLEIRDDLCVINFRGGEYSLYPDLFLTQEYWQEAIGLTKSYFAPWGSENDWPKPKFIVMTDDEVVAKRFFPDYECLRDIAYNWRSVRYAKHLILANSAFGIIPALLNENVKEVLAPRKWAGRNLDKEWQRPQNYYKKFIYI